VILHWAGHGIRAVGVSKPWHVTHVFFGTARFGTPRCVDPLLQEALSIFPGAALNLASIEKHGRNAAAVDQRPVSRHAGERDD
jgi:hypothetical protein